MRVCVLKEPEACASLCRVFPPPLFSYILLFSCPFILLLSFLLLFSSPLFLSPVKCRQDCLNKVEHRKWYTRSVAISECSLTLRHLTNRIDKSIKCRNIQEPHGWHGIKRFQSQQHDCFLPFFFLIRHRWESSESWLASSIRYVCAARKLYHHFFVSLPPNISAITTTACPTTWALSFSLFHTHI